MKQNAIHTNTALVIAIIESIPDLISRAGNSVGGTHRAPWNSKV